MKKYYFVLSDLGAKNTLSGHAHTLLGVKHIFKKVTNSYGCSVFKKYRNSYRNTPFVTYRK